MEATERQAQRHAAVTAQRVVRGHLVRQSVKEEAVVTQEGEALAAALEVEAAKCREQGQASVTVQNVARGHFVRNLTAGP